MTKELLAQYIDLKQEEKELKERIVKIQQQIDDIEAEGAVVDKVTGGMGGIQSFRIEGFPIPEYSRKKTLLCLRKANLQELEEKIMVSPGPMDILRCILRAIRLNAAILSP